MGEGDQLPAIPTNRGGEKTPAANDEDRNPSRNRRNHHRNRGNKQKWKDASNTPIHIPREKFLGLPEDLEGFIYDISNTKGGVAYTRTTEEIARYIGEKYISFGSVIRAVVLTIVVATPTRPTALAADITTGNIDYVDTEIFCKGIRMFVKTRAAIESAVKSLYNLIWGQCSESLRSRRQGYDNYTTYSTEADSTSLLKGIHAEMTGFRNKQYLPHSLHNTMREFYNLAQGKHRSNQEYYDKFNSMVDTACKRKQSHHQSTPKWH
jgi:hypothetical protein